MHAFATSSDRPVLIKRSVMQQMYFTCFSLLVPALPSLLLLHWLQSWPLFKVFSFSFALVSNRFPLVSSLRPLSVCQSAVCVWERESGELKASKITRGKWYLLSPPSKNLATPPWAYIRPLSSDTHIHFQIQAPLQKYHARGEFYSHPRLWLTPSWPWGFMLYIWL